MPPQNRLQITDCQIVHKWDSQWRRKVSSGAMIFLFDLIRNILYLYDISLSLFLVALVISTASHTYWRGIIFDPSITTAAAGWAAEHTYYSKILYCNNNIHRPHRTRAHLRLLKTSSRNKTHVAVAVVTISRATTP